MDNAPESASHSPPDANRIAFDQLDTLVHVTSVHAWIYLTVLFAVGAGAVAFAILYKVPTKVNGEGILLIDHDRLARVRARATGRLVSLSVKMGDPVSAGQVIGRVAQDDLKDAIDEAKARLENLQGQDRELTQFEGSAERKDEAMDQLREAVVHAQADSREKMKIAQRLVKGADKLRYNQFLGDLDLLESREKLYDVRDDLNKGQSRLAELALERVAAETARGRARLERKLKIRDVETKLKLDLEKMERTSRLISPVQGQVAQVLHADGDLVPEGSPIVLLHAPKVGRGTDDSGSSYESIVFVPGGEGKKVEPNNPVEIVPATIKREEYGFIRGRVVEVSELPATKLAMEAALEHSELVDAFLKRYAPGVLLRVLVRLEKGDPRRQNPFHWSSSNGPDQTLKTGTMCQAAIVVERRRLIQLILPWTKKLVGAG